MLACSQVFDPEFRKGFPNVQRWYTTLTHFPHFSAVFQVKDLAKETLKGMVLSSPMPVHTSGNLICAQIYTVCIASKYYTVHIASKVNSSNTPNCCVRARVLTFHHSHIVKTVTELLLWLLVHGQICIVFWVPVPVLEVLSCWCSSEACSAAKRTAAAETKGAAAAKAQGAGTETSAAASGEPAHFHSCLAMQSLQTLCSAVVFEVVLPAGNLPT